MKKYYMFFKLRFAAGIQYRMATLTALTTQLLWGLMECLAYRAIANAYGNRLPMEYPAIVAYIWLRQALLVLFQTWNADNDIFNMIINGDIAYELCRPISVYSMWLSRNIGGRVSQALLKCVPILLCAFFMPKPYRMSLPVSGTAFILFLFTTILGITAILLFPIMFSSLSSRTMMLHLRSLMKFFQEMKYPYH